MKQTLNKTYNKLLFLHLQYGCTCSFISDVGYSFNNDPGHVLTVLNAYFTVYFPRAAKVALDLYVLGYSERFIYTTHPWLVSLYLDCPPNMVLSGIKLQVSSLLTIWYFVNQILGVLKTIHYNYLSLLINKFKQLRKMGSELWVRNTCCRHQKTWLENFKMHAVLHASVIFARSIHIQSITESLCMILKHDLIKMLHLTKTLYNRYDISYFHSAQMRRTAPSLNKWSVWVSSRGMPGPWTWSTRWWMRPWWSSVFYSVLTWTRGLAYAENTGLSASGMCQVCLTAVVTMF